MPNPRLSAVIITKNAESSVKDCLESVKWADEIIIVDGYSTDRTVEICKGYTDKIILSEFKGFAGERNKGIDHATCDWVLQLDADEVVTPGLAKALKEAMASPGQYTGYKFRRRNFFLGHPMRYGGWYHYSSHFFKKGSGRYEGLIHERLKLDGLQGTIEAEIEHRPFTSLSQFISRQNRYTTYEASDFLNEMGVLSKGRVKYHLYLKPAKVFWKFYVKKQGFREGMTGFIFSALYSYVHFMKWAKYWELAYGQKAK